MEDLRFPTGRYQRPSFPLTDAARDLAIATIAETPARFRAAVEGLDDAQLDTPYRDGGWTVRQLAHHLPDSHMNAYVRFKLGLTEEVPTVKPYEEGAWAELPDARTMPVEVSLVLLERLHDRWVTMLRAMSAEDYARKIRHPEHGELPLDFFLTLYAWHGPHHVAHVTRLRERMGCRPVDGLQASARRMPGEQESGQ